MRLDFLPFERAGGQEPSAPVTANLVPLQGGAASLDGRAGKRRAGFLRDRAGDRAGRLSEDGKKSREEEEQGDA